MSSVLRFTVSYGLYGAALATIAYAIGQADEKLLADQFWVFFGFLFALTYIAFILSFMGIKKGGQTAVFLLMAGIIIKLLLAMVFSLIYIKQHPVNQVVFALNYFSLYLLFTVFEVISLLRILRHQNN